MSNPSSETPTAGTNSATPSTSWGADSDAAAAGFSAAAGAAASGWRQKLPFRVRSRPRVFGVGRYGIDKADSRDDTRYAWTRVGPALLGLSLTLISPLIARAQNTYCESADGTTSVYGFCKPSVDVEGANAWGLKYNTNADLMDTALNSQQTNLTALSASTVALSAAKVSKTGDTMTGPLYLTGTQGFVKSASSITAANFYGDGSHLTGVTASGGFAGFFASDDFTSLANGTQTTFTLSQAPASIASLVVILDGLTKRYSADYTFSSLTLTMNSPPAANSSSFVAYYTVNTTTLTTISTIHVLGTEQVDGALTAASSVTAGAFYGYGGNLTNRPCHVGAGASSVLCQGSGNTADGDKSINLGGENNTIAVAADHAVIGGGDTNSISAHHGVIPGGSNNTITVNGVGSFVAGTNGRSNAANEFVFSDNSGSVYTGNGNNTFNARALNGAFFQTPIFRVGTTSFTVVGGSATLAYQLAAGSILLSGSTGTFISQSSVTASAFFGDGSALTNLPGTFQSSVTLQASAFSIGGSTFVVNNGSVSVAGAKFLISKTGDLTKVNNVATSFPSSQGAVNSVLQNDGGGNMSWVGTLKDTSGTNSINLNSHTLHNTGSSDVLDYANGFLLSGTSGRQTLDWSNSQLNTWDSPNGAYRIPGRWDTLGQITLGAASDTIGTRVIVSTSLSVSNTFDVGTSSFVVKGGSVTVAYLMSARAFSGDGSALSNVGGGISLGANNAFTGANTQSNSETYLSGSALTVNAGASCTGVECRVAYSSGAMLGGGTSAAFSFTGLTSSQTYRIQYTVGVTSGSSTNGQVICRFNTDAGADYTYFQTGGASNGTALDQYQASYTNGTTFFVLSGHAGQTSQTSDGASGTFTFGSMWGWPGVIQFHGENSAFYANRALTELQTLGGIWTTNVAFSDIECFMQTGQGGVFEAILYKVGK